MKWMLPTASAQLPLVMGILNVTPDSFSDGGQFTQLDAAIQQVALMVSDGADLVDVGGESTRPGANHVETEQELDRVIPIIEAIRERFDIAISVDTTKPEVMTAATKAGAVLINDVNGLEAEGALEAAARANVPVCVMHRQGSAETMQQQPAYDDVVEEVSDYLDQRVQACVAAGIPQEQVIIDPGFGFGKTLNHNLQLFQALPQLTRVQPVLVGVSRKSMIGSVLDRNVDDRLSGSLALAALATWLGTALIRVHDVKETVDAIRITCAVRDVAYTSTASTKQ